MLQRAKHFDLSQRRLLHRFVVVALLSDEEAARGGDGWEGGGRMRIRPLRRRVGDARARPTRGEGGRGGRAVHRAMPSMATSSRRRERTDASSTRAGGRRRPARGREGPEIRTRRGEQRTTRDAP
eukprot:30772-Pelagococcus_subviridis.AAC.4